MFGRNASSSTFFSSAFDKVEISESGMFLIHNVWGGVVGNAEELRKQADEFEKHDDVIIDIYKKKTGLPKAEIKELMNLGKWYNAKEAKKLGFVDSIFKPSKSQNIIKQSIYNKYLPEMENNENKGIHIVDEKSFLEKISNVFKPEVKDIKKD
jgi:ATP-dependent protease ClpP protease subunit